MHTVEDLIDFTITKIEHPLNLIPEMIADNIYEMDDFLEEEEFNSRFEDMEYNNHHDE